jgi:uncharacterized protein YpuA (DUF1002 family)
MSKKYIEDISNNMNLDSINNSYDLEQHKKRIGYVGDFLDEERRNLDFKKIQEELRKSREEYKKLENEREADFENIMIDLWLNWEDIIDKFGVEAILDVIGVEKLREFMEKESTN